MKLIDALRERGFRSSLSATFSCDLGFYDSVMLSKMRASGCVNNVLLTDAGNYARSIHSLSNLAPNAGRLYTIVPVSLPGAFHPKIVLQLGEHRGRALVGSANLSSRGFGRNREIVTKIECTKEESVSQRLVASVFDYLRRFINTGPTALTYSLRRALEDAPWLEKAARAADAVALHDRSAVALLATPDANILEDFTALASKDTIKRLVILAPFWDAELRALQDLISLLDPAMTDIIIDVETSSFPGRLAATLGPGVKVHAWKGEDGRYLHAKAVIAEGERHDHLLTGSANCSLPALGGRGESPRNAELCVYRRIDPGTALEYLGLRNVLMDGAPLDAMSLETLVVHGHDATGPSQGQAGHFERQGSNLLWWPPRGLQAGATRVELLDSSLIPVCDPLEMGGSQNPLQRPWPQTSTGARFARAVGHDGSTTIPSIIHLPADLRRAAPGKAGEQLQDLLERIHLGESDFLELLTPLERVVFAREETPAKGRGKGNHREDEDAVESQDVEGDPLPYSEFVKARRKPADGGSDIVSAVSSNVAILIDYLLRSLGPERGGEEELVDTTDDEAGDNPAADHGNIQVGERVDRKEVTTYEELAKSRRRVRKLADRFLKWARARAAQGECHVGGSEVGRLWGLVVIVLYLGH